MIIKLLIKIYQVVLRPLVKIILPEGQCRFTPTCSDYYYQAVSKYGIVKGTLLGTKRIIRCQPFSQGGYDPV